MGGSVGHVHVINTHGLGDVVMTLPMLREIDEDGFVISMTVKSRLVAELVRDTFSPRHGPVRLLICNPKEKRLTSNAGYLLKLRQLRADLILPAVGVNETLYNIAAAVSGARFRVGHGGRLGWLNNSNCVVEVGLHKVTQNVATYRHAVVSWLGRVKEDKPPAFPEFRMDGAIFDSLDSRFPGLLNSKPICFAPGSGEVEKHKRWPVDYYGKLAEVLLRRGRAVAVLGGREERMLGRTIASHVPNGTPFWDLTGHLDIKEVLHVLSICDQLVANCNGLAHMASVVGARIVGIYGPTDYRYTGPYTTELRIVSKMLPCSPCYRRGFITGCGDPVCMTGIHWTDVIENMWQN